MLFVSEAVARDYRNYITTGPACTVLYNFVKDEFFQAQHSKEIGATIGDCFKVIAVGSLRTAKNYAYVLKAFELLKNRNVHLTIVGAGPLQTELQELLTRKNICNVTLLGNYNHVYEVLKQYDSFILSSVYEGMSLAVIEAMAVGLPCILSDIAPNREVTANNALFFDLSSPEDCANKILELKNNPKLRDKLMYSGKQRAQKFKKEVYLQKLEALYNQYLQPYKTA